MKSFYSVVAILAILILCASGAFGQSAGDYRSNAPLPTGGAWSVAGNWQKYSGTVWQTASSAPTGSEVITVLSTDSIRVDVPITITGTLINQGKVVDLGNLTIDNGGTYRNDQNGGRIPDATWNTGSTLMITSVTSQAPSNAKQTFYNVVWNCPGQTANLNLGWSPSASGGDTTVDVAGTITVMASGGSNRWQLSAPQAGSDSNHVTTARVIIHGGINVSGGAFSSNGTSNAYTRVIVTTLGNVNVTGGNFSVSRGSMSGLGTVTWYLQGDSIAMSNARTQNSNQVVGAAKFVFNKPGIQYLRFGTGNTLSSFPFEVATGTTLNCGTSAIYGDAYGVAIVDSGATVATAHTGGADSLFATSGPKTLSTSANYTFNGSSHQVTGTLLPTTVADLTIDNAAGVTLTQATTINDTLHLKAGVFDNTIPFTLGPNGVVSYEGGSLITSVRDAANGIPKVFFVDQNYPNPFNPTTTIRFGLPHRSAVTVTVSNMLGQRVALLQDGEMNAGIYYVDFDATSFGSGVYFVKVQTDNAVRVKSMVLVK